MLILFLYLNTMRSLTFSHIWGMIISIPFVLDGPLPHVQLHDFFRPVAKIYYFKQSFTIFSHILIPSFFFLRYFCSWPIVSIAARFNWSFKSKCLFLLILWRKVCLYIYSFLHSLLFLCLILIYFLEEVVYPFVHWLVGIKYLAT